MRSALIALGVVAGLLSGGATAADNDGTMSAHNLAVHPTCVMFQGDRGRMAHIQGAVVDRNGDPVAGALPVLRASDGRVFHPVTGDDGFYILDVPAPSRRLILRVVGTRVRMTCVVPRVPIG